MSWDTIISILIIAALILVIFAKVSHQTVGETISDLIDRIKGRTEDTVEGVREISF